MWFALAPPARRQPEGDREYRGFNLVTFRDVIHAVRRGATLDLARLRGIDRRALIAGRDLIVGPNAEEVKRHVDAVLVIEKHGLTEHNLEDAQDPHAVERQIRTILCEEEMRRQREVVCHWPPLRRLLWTTRKGLARIKRKLVGTR